MNTGDIYWKFQGDYRTSNAVTKGKNIYIYVYIQISFFSNKTPYLHANSIIYLLFVDLFVQKKKIDEQ